MVRITMKLAQAPWAEQGDLDDHLEMRICLDAAGRLDVPAFGADPDAWLATRHQPGQHPRTKKFLRIDDAWALRSLRSDDEPLWSLCADLYRPGEIVCLRQPDGTELLFRIVAVDPV